MLGPADLPSSLKAERHPAENGAVAVLKLARAQKRNALDDPTVLGIEAFFSTLPDDIRAVVIAGEGEHFSAGLDLSDWSIDQLARVERRVCENEAELQDAVK